MSTSGLMLNVGAFVGNSRVNGPGTRAVVWLKGCARRCPGCVNPHLWDASPAELVTPEDLAERALRSGGIEGVTYSGGEPFLQARGLVVFSRLVKARGLSVACYTGYTLEELAGAEDPDWQRLLAELDILIDGEFRLELRRPLLWRGSSNQRVHFLTGRYASYAGRVDEAWREFEMHVVGDRVLLTGFISREATEAVAASLSERGGLDITGEQVER